MPPTRASRVTLWTSCKSTGRKTWSRSCARRPQQTSGGQESRGGSTRWSAAFVIRQEMLRGSDRRSGRLRKQPSSFWPHLPRPWPSLPPRVLVMRRLPVLLLRCRPLWPGRFAIGTSTAARQSLRNWTAGGRVPVLRCKAGQMSGSYCWKKKGFSYAGLNVALRSSVRSGHDMQPWQPLGMRETLPLLDIMEVATGRPRALHCWRRLSWRCAGV
mmetsp:Transcript_139111/g.242045  ORF Transcript_139111/g.242045 Transcript_139111/m.242045 type:complete len:214 (-) Transcript_139111:1424-2065(-)